MKKNALIAMITIVTINVFSWLLLMPSVQKTANCHMNQGPLWGTIYYVISGLLFIYFIKNQLKNTSTTRIIFFVLLISTFIFWGYKLHSIYCLGCASGG